MSGTVSPRRAAVDLLNAVLMRGQLLTEARIDGAADPAVRARAKRLAETVLRRLSALDSVLDGYLDRSPPGKVRNILRLAAAETLIEEVPPHAVVSSAVDLAAQDRKLKGFRGLINAVARRVSQTDRDAWLKICEVDPVFPPDLQARLAKAWGAESVAIMAALHTERPPVDLTIRDPARLDAFAEALTAKRLPTGSLRLDNPGQISSLPGFEAGEWWVQDAAAALPVRLLGDVSGLRVLDLCAAPGGKTMQLAAAGADVTALDLSASRVQRLRDNLSRTRLSAEIVVADALEWQTDQRFDLLLLDAPCSASGTMRRHPDLMRRPLASLAPLVKLQDALLDRAFTWVKPGGRMLFATCSLFPQEGEVRLRGFLRRQPKAHLEPLQGHAALDPAWVEQDMLRLRPDHWPEIGGMDGFFAAIVRCTP